MVTLLEKDLSPHWYDAAIAARLVGMDIETTGLDKLYDKVATIQMYVPNVGTVMVRNLDNPQWIGQLLEERKVVKIFHHSSFDLAFLIRDMGIWPENIADTEIAARLIDPDRKKYIHPMTNKPSYALVALVKYYFNELLDKTLSVSDWMAETLDQEQLDYAEKDVLYLPELLRKMEFELSEIGERQLAQSVYEGIVANVILESKNIRSIYGY